MPPTRSTAASTASIVSPEVHRSIVNKVRATTLHQLLDQSRRQFWPQLAAVAFIVWLSWDNASKLHLAFGSVPGGRDSAGRDMGVLPCAAPIRYGRSARAMGVLYPGVFSSQLVVRCVRYYAFALGGPREELFPASWGIDVHLAQFSRADVKAAVRNGGHPSMRHCWLRICRAVRKRLPYYGWPGWSADHALTGG